VVLVNKALTAAYKATNECWALEKQTEWNWRHSYSFLPLLLLIFTFWYTRFCPWSRS